MKPKYGILFALFVTAAFLACSDEVVSQKTEYGTTGDAKFVADIDDLPDCDEKNEKSLFWVSSESVFRVCKDEEWYAVMPVGEPSDSKVSCKTEKLKKESGVKIVCDGDSVGVLLNGVDADSVIYLDSTTLASLFGIDLEMGPEEVVLDSEQVVTSVEDVSGFTQKGPFLLGSEVVAYELQNGRTLKQTGKQFHGKITDDRGSFNIRTIKVASQYAFLAAKGFYRNEVSGKVSDQQITLNALTDLRSRNLVNINVLTHLEYDRVVQLVTKEDYTVRKAKKKAEEEIFKIFHMDSLKIDGVSEDFSIGGNGAGDAALLAISILMQRNLKEAVMQSQITSMSEAIAKGGKGNSDSLKAAMADWVSKQEITGKINRIRVNVEGWKLGDEVPAFEPLLHHFWIEEYGIGECTKQRVGEIFAVENRFSVNDKSVSAVRFACVDSSDVGYTWRYATDIEKDTYKWSPGSSDGAVKKGDLTNNSYVYDVTEKKWKTALTVELLYGGCRQELFGQIRRIDGFNAFYRCVESSHSWEPVYNYAEIDTQGWGAGEDGETRWGDTLGVSVTGSTVCYLGKYNDFREVTKLKNSYYDIRFTSSKSDRCSCQLVPYDYQNKEAGYLLYEGDETDVALTYCNAGERACYYYNGVAGKWVYASSDYCMNDYDLGVCSSNHLGELKYSESNNRVYECARHVEGEGDEEIVKIYWTEVNDYIVANTYNVECDEDKWVTGFLAKDVHFVCDGGSWRKASVLEEYVGEPCCLKNQAAEKEVDGETYSCIDSEWRARDDVAINTENQECDEDKWILGSYASDVHFVCDYNGWERYWRNASNLEEQLGTPCYWSVAGYEMDDGVCIYVCDYEGWYCAYEY